MLLSQLLALSHADTCRYLIYLIFLSYQLAWNWKITPSIDNFSESIYVIKPKAERWWSDNTVLNIESTWTFSISGDLLAKPFTFVSGNTKKSRFNPFRKKSGLLNVLARQSTKNRICFKNGYLNTFTPSDEAQTHKFLQVSKSLWWFMFDFWFCVGSTSTSVPVEFKKKIAVRSAIAKSKIGIAKTRSF